MRLLVKKFEPEIKQICKPLFKISKINFFRFMRLYNDDSRIILSSDSSWIQYFFDKSYYKQAWFDNKPFHFYSSGKVLWDEKNLREGNIVGIDAQLLFHQHHGATFIYRFSNFTEFYEFATFQENDAINNFYVNSTNLFERFIWYFKEKADKIIKEYNNQKIILPESNLNSIDLEDNDEVNEFIKATIIKKFPFYKGTEEYHLSSREAECAYHLSMGKSIKEIANLVDLSPRTVEAYLNNIKAKLNVTCRSKLIDLFNENGLQSFINVLKCDSMKIK
jgi:DNA-binding CsgD family transcriptional regulator